MKYGAPFMGAFGLDDPILIRDYVQAVEDLGYSHLFCDEILLNDDPAQTYHELLTLFAYLSGVTSKIIFVSGIIVLPKRQTLLFARQAAEVDVLSNGRLRLGVAVGWKESEFNALGIDFRTRGKRIDEQIPVLQKLWTQEKISFKGEFHQIEDIGINLLPIQRPIPIWIGGSADVVLRRAARWAQGLMLDESVADTLGEHITTLQNYLAENGRDTQNFRIIKYLKTNKIPQAQWGQNVEAWKKAGVTHTTLLSASGKGKFHKLDQFIEELVQFKREIDS